MTLTYDHCKRHPAIVDLNKLIGYAQEQANLGTIDPTTNLKGLPVYLYRGTKDTCYLNGSLANVQTLFETLGAKVKFNKIIHLHMHPWPTPYNSWNPGLFHSETSEAFLFR
jgi:hypothetical protein